MSLNTTIRMNTYEKYFTLNVSSGDWYCTKFNSVKLEEVKL